MTLQHSPDSNSLSLYEKRDELRRILQSKHFAKAPKKTHFLEFVSEQTFLGNGDKLNEYLIGVEIYGRGPDFNPADDPIVRVQAHEIRRSLKRYYEEEGKTDPVRVDLPSGHYVPVFGKAELGERDADKPTPAGTIDAGLAGTVGRRQRALILGLALACTILAVLYVRERLRAPLSLPTAAPAASLPESLEWFWKPFLPPASGPLVVLPNHPLLRAAHDGDSPQTFAQSHVIPKEKLPEFRDTIHFRELKGFYFVPSTTDFTAMGESLGLFNLFELFTRARQSMRLKQSRLVDFDEIKRGNAILLGGNQAWSGRIFLYSEGFLFHSGVISNKHPRAGEQPVYRPEFDPVTNNLTRDYALVLMLPNERKAERILLIYGIYTQGSQAAIEYVTEPERLSELQKALTEQSPRTQGLPPYFEALLTTTVENYVPSKASLVGLRVIPE